MGIQIMIRARFRVALIIGIAAIVLCEPASALGQARPTATGPGTYLAVGGMFSLFEGDYGQRKIRGSAAYVDANLFRCYGLETEFRRLSYTESPGMNQTTLLAGPRVSFRSHGVVPYAKMLVGIGIFNFPYHDGRGSYLALAPGAGLDWNMGRRIRLRLIDVEYQDWSQFTFGPEHPYGASVGISYQIVSSGGLGHLRYRRD